METKKASNTKDREIVISRLISAPRELVFDAFTKKEHADKWWGPRGFTNTTQEMNVKPGGVWLFDMHGWGQTFPNKIVFKDVVKPERLTYTHGAPGEETYFDVVITFKKQGNKTLLTMQSVFESAETLKKLLEEAGVAEGGKQHIDKLEEHVAYMLAGRSYDITRSFNCSRELLWKVWTDPVHMAKWWGPKGFTMLKSEIDLKPGGMYHYGMKSPDGHEMWGKMVYRELSEPERMIVVVSFCDENANAIRHPMAPNWPLEVLTTSTFTEENGKATLHMSGVPLNASAEEIAMYNSATEGMNQGFKGTFDQLDEYLATLK